MIQNNLKWSPGCATCPVRPPLSRAQLVAKWITTVPLLGNDDSTKFGNRVANNLQAVITAGASDDLMPAIRLASQSARNAAARYDSAAQAKLANTASAATIRPLTQYSGPRI